MSKIIDMLLDIADQGYTVEDLKKSVIDTITPFFDHPEKAIRFWTSSDLLSVFEFIIRYHYEPEFRDGLYEVLDFYKFAIKSNEELTFSIISDTAFDFTQKDNMMWTVRQNVNEINNGDYFERIIYYFKHIGDVLEIGTKHFIYEICALLQIAKGFIPDYEKIRSLDFGVGIQNILDQKKLSTVLTTKPISIKLSDWRNIAYHHTYRVIDETHISCTYGKKQLSFMLNTDELVLYTHKIVRASNIINIARCIFIFDYYDEFAKYKDCHKKEMTIKFRNSILENRLRVSLLSQSFLLDNIVEENDTVIASVIDLLNNGSLSAEKERERYIHSSQFLYEVWCEFGKDRIQIKYYSRENIIKLISTVKGEVCKKIACGEKELEYMVQYVDFKFQS